MRLVSTNRSMRSPTAYEDGGDLACELPPDPVLCPTPRSDRRRDDPAVRAEVPTRPSPGRCSARRPQGRARLVRSPTDAGAAGFACAWRARAHELFWRSTATVCWGVAVSLVRSDGSWGTGDTGTHGNDE